MVGLAELDLDKPSGCSEWTVRDLIEHMVGQNVGFARAIASGDADEGSYHPAPVTQWAASIAALGAAIAAPAASIRLVELHREARFDLATVLTIHLIDTVAHTWDLAPGSWRPDADIVELVLARAKEISDDARGPGKPFGPIRPASDADPWHEALGLLGRSSDARA